MSGTMTAMVAKLYYVALSSRWYVIGLGKGQKIYDQGVV